LLSFHHREGDVMYDNEYILLDDDLFWIEETGEEDNVETI